MNEKVSADGQPPRRIVIGDPTFDPLGYEQLRDLLEPAKLELTCRGRVVESYEGGPPVGSIRKSAFELESHLTTKTFGLVPGGWLPPALAAKNESILLLDRCAVSELASRFKNGMRNERRQQDFLDLFVDQPVRINPLFFALEGNNKGCPHPTLVKAQLDEAVVKLRSALPKASIVAATNEGFDGLLGLLRDSERTMERHQNFLLQIAPRLVAPVSKEKRQERWEEVDSAAVAHGIRRSSLALLAALSTILVPNGASPAKRLLHVGPNYTEADAYNAAADLRSLNILMHLFARFPQSPTMLCTTDKPLALFWAGLRPSKFASDRRGMTYNLSFDVLFPDLTPEQLAYLQAVG